MDVIASELARHLGLSAARISYLNKQGALDEAKRGKRRGRQLYDRDVAEQILKARSDPNYTKDTPQARYRNKKTKGGGNNGNGDDDDSFLTWRTHSERYKAAEKKLDFEIKQGKYVLKTEVERIMFIIGRQLRESLLNAPARTSALVAAKSKKAQDDIYQILMRQAELTLKDITEKLKKAVV